MAKGTIAKEQIMQKLMEVFPNSFIYEKTLRIPIVENGETVQIKVTLTAAKENVECGADTATPVTVSNEINFNSSSNIPMAPTEEEKRNVESALKALGF